MSVARTGAIAALAACLVGIGAFTTSWAADSEIEEVVYGFDGIYKGDQRLKVTKGTKHVQEAKLVKKTVAFDMTVSQIDVDDTNDDGYNDFRDILSGDRVTIKTELPKKRPGKPPFPARLVVDQTHLQPRCESGSRPGCRP
jgi:hypothetical protein